MLNYCFLHRGFEIFRFILNDFEFKLLSDSFELLFYFMFYYEVFF